MSEDNELDDKKASPDGGKLIAKLVPCDPPTSGFWYSPFELVEEYEY